MEYALKIGLLMALLPVLLIKIVSMCEIDVSQKFKEVTVMILLIGIALLVVSFIHFTINH